MADKKVLIIIVIAVVTFYWLWPLGKLLVQYRISSTNLQSNVSLLPAPIIENVYILPDYESLPNKNFNVYSKYSEPTRKTPEAEHLTSH